MVFHWGNPFFSNGNRASTLAAAKGNRSAASRPPGGGQSSRNKISLRARTFNGERLKVNDKRGNPIEIAAVVVWRVQDTAQAVFDVDDYENLCRRRRANRRSGIWRACTPTTMARKTRSRCAAAWRKFRRRLRKELQERLAKAGVTVEEARLTHLAYAPEIAQAMLRRQQAEAVIAARQKIVHGAVSMVDMALKELAEKHVVQLDDERKAAMVSNLMVVLCGESEVHPVVNTGTLYT